MNNLEQLFIRACKSQKSQARFERLIPRFYCAEYTPAHVSIILADICQKYNLLDVGRLVNSLNPAHKWKYASSPDRTIPAPWENTKGTNPAYHENIDDYWMHVQGYLRSVIANTKADKFPGLKAPLALRIRFGEK